MQDITWIIEIVITVPVSYTHLDVYKRQAPMCVILQQN